MIILALPIVLFSCKSTKLVNKGEHLLVKNNIVYDSIVNDVTKVSGVESQVKHIPNRRILGTIRFHLSVYNVASKKRNHPKNEKNKVRKYLREHVGEAPILVDSQLVQSSAKNIQDYLISKGYFDATVQPEYIYKRKKAKVKYHIKTNHVYHYDSIQYYIPDEDFANLFKTKYKSIVGPGAAVNFDVLNIERSKFTDFAKNKGYFYFKKDYITYELDTNQVSHKAVIKTAIVNRPEEGKQIKCFTNSIHFIICGGL